MTRGKGGTALIRRTKIVATLGPATGTPEGIAGLIEAGANVIRVNASHGTPELRAEWIAAVRRGAAAAGAPGAPPLGPPGPPLPGGQLPPPPRPPPGAAAVFRPRG